MDRHLYVHLLPSLVPADRLREGVVVVIDVLRASTTIIHALGAGCSMVWPVATQAEAEQLALDLAAQGQVALLGGERACQPIPGFDLGNSPSDYTQDVCRGKPVILTTTNGTKALLHAAAAARVLVAGFVNFSAVCEQLARETRSIHLLCAGTDEQITLEDTLLAGAFVDVLHGESTAMCDSARLAWDCFEHHGTIVEEGLRLSLGGRNLMAAGYEDDLILAAQIDRFLIVPELRRNPLRLEVGAVGLARSHWPTRWPAIAKP
jgi:2-phosphosulfolactate phosphatase